MTILHYSQTLRLVNKNSTSAQGAGTFSGRVWQPAKPLREPWGAIEIAFLQKSPFRFVEKC
jgi:hypothetical protein